MITREPGRTVVRHGEVELILPDNANYFTVGRRDSVIGKFTSADVTPLIMCLVERFSACAHTGPVMNQDGPT